MLLLDPTVVVKSEQRATAGRANDRSALCDYTAVLYHHICLLLWTQKSFQYSSTPERKIGKAGCTPLRLPRFKTTRV